MTTDTFKEEDGNVEMPVETQLMVAEASSRHANEKLFEATQRVGELQESLAEATQMLDDLTSPAEHPFTDEQVEAMTDVVGKVAIKELLKLPFLTSTNVIDTVTLDLQVKVLELSEELEEIQTQLGEVKGQNMAHKNQIAIMTNSLDNMRQALSEQAKFHNATMSDKDEQLAVMKAQLTELGREFGEIFEASQKLFNSGALGVRAIEAITNAGGRTGPEQLRAIHATRKQGGVTTP